MALVVAALSLSPVAVAEEPVAADSCKETFNRLLVAPMRSVRTYFGELSKSGPVLTLAMKAVRKGVDEQAKALAADLGRDEASLGALEADAAKVASPAAKARLDEMVRDQKRRISEKKAKLAVALEAKAEKNAQVDADNATVYGCFGSKDADLKSADGKPLHWTTCYVYDVVKDDGTFVVGLKPVDPAESALFLVEVGRDPEHVSPVLLERSVNDLVSYSLPEGCADPGRKGAAGQKSGRTAGARLAPTPTEPPASTKPPDTATAPAASADASPAPASPAPTSGNAIRLPLSYAAASFQELEAAARVEGAGKPVAQPFVARFLEGYVLRQPLQLMPGNCFTVVALGYGPTEVDAQILVEMPPLPPFIAAQDSSSGRIAVMGGKSTGCWKYPAPIAGPATILLRATRGGGMVVGQVYAK